MSGPEISEAEHEVTLHEERPVTKIETVPVERVRLETEEVTEEKTVRGQVRAVCVRPAGVGRIGRSSHVHRPERTPSSPESVGSWPVTLPGELGGHGHRTVQHSL